jgi:hypothetical protein
MFDPIEAKRNARYTREELTEFFKGNGTVAQRLKRENPPKYAELHAEAEKLNILGPSLIKTPAPNTPYKPPTRSYTPSELVVRGQFTESYCRELFASGDSKAAKALFEANPERYQDAKDASISFGILPPRLTPRPPAPPAPVKEYLHRVSDELADESHIARGTTLPWAQVEQLVQQKVQRARQVQEAADAKVAADRATELATLTAKQQAEQVARDRHQADLDRLVELTTPKPNVTLEPAQLATAKAVAEERAKSVEVPIIDQ